MQQKNRVLKSINIEDESRCVDIFLRGDNTVGFEEFRRDVEDTRGWFAIGFFGDLVFDSEKAALEAAIFKVPWLSDAVAKSQVG